MLTIVEGIDRIGKSTFCKEMQKQINNAIIFTWDGITYDNKRITKDLTNFNETQKILTLIKCYEQFGQDKNIYCDRLHLSDAVYGMCERQYPFLQTANNFKMLDDIISKIPNVRLILLTYDNVKKISQEHGRDLRKHYSLFLDLFDNSNIPIKQKLQYRNW